MPMHSHIAKFVDICNWVLHINLMTLTAGVQFLRQGEHTVNIYGAVTIYQFPKLNKFTPQHHSLCRKKNVFTVSQHSSFRNDCQSFVQHLCMHSNFLASSTKQVFQRHESWSSDGLVCVLKKNIISLVVWYTLEFEKVVEKIRHIIDTNRKAAESLWKITAWTDIPCMFQ